MRAIPNPEAVNLETVAERLQVKYPGTRVRKMWIGPAFLQAPQGNYKLLLRKQNRRKRFVVDINPPPLVTALGMFGFAFLISFIASMIVGQPVITLGALIIALGAVLVKAIFSKMKKTELSTFEQDVHAALRPDEGSIF